MEENQTPETVKQDVIDRKAALLERIFDKLFSAVKENVFATLLVLAIIVIFWQQSTINDITALRLAEKDKSKEEMINEVRRNVERELAKQLVPIQAQTDSNSRKLDTSLINLNGTVETVKQYIIKKTK